ncbi:hypothetical protein EJ04DRAFT_560331 [Polyplosphaeria fusca]|uniref:Uncharacterized protein n=1 Tax=Polyplosphaeria fusca TaxID=682080 RepID=A0A9P4R5C8_9PLEO|nr:hypothetical protein EJ04DRAFT_560331 [Polyplosphaeria fusca]
METGVPGSAEALNPTAVAYIPDATMSLYYPDSLYGNAVGFVPAYQALAYTVFPPFKPKDTNTKEDLENAELEVQDVVKHTYVQLPNGTALDTNVVERVSFETASNVLVLTVDTYDIRKDATDGSNYDDVNTFVQRAMLPTTVQLNVLTGPRFPGYFRVLQWLKDSLGPHVSMVQNIQICILRHGERDSTKFRLPQMELKKFAPLCAFVHEIKKVFLPTTSYLWGCSKLHERMLQEHLLGKAVPDTLEALQHVDDSHKVTEYSKAIEGRILQEISMEKYVTVQNSTETLTSDQVSDQSNVSSRSIVSTLNPSATDYVPQSHVFGSSYAEPAVGCFTPQPFFMAGQDNQNGFNLQDPFYSQLAQVDQYCSQAYDSGNMNVHKYNTGHISPAGESEGIYNPGLNHDYSSTAKFAYNNGTQPHVFNGNASKVGSGHWYDMPQGENAYAPYYNFGSFSKKTKSFAPNGKGPRLFDPDKAALAPKFTNKGGRKPYKPKNKKNGKGQDFNVQDGNVYGTDGHFTPGHGPSFHGGFGNNGRVNGTAGGSSFGQGASSGGALGNGGPQDGSAWLATQPAISY